MTHFRFPTAEEKTLVGWLLDASPAAGESLRAWLAATSFEKTSQATHQLIPGIFVAVRDVTARDDRLPARLVRLYRSLWIRHQATIHAALGAARSLRGEGIPVALVGGMPLSLSYYCDPGARLLQDAELVIRPGDQPRADQLLVAAGWRLRAMATSAEALEYRLESGAALTVRTSAMRGLWARCADEIVRGEPVLVPDPTGLLLLSCLRGAEGAVAVHARALWILDAGAILERRGDRVDWGELVSLAREAGMLAPVRDALVFLRQEMGLPIPAETVAALAHLPAWPASLPTVEPIAPRGLAHDGTVCLVGILKNEERFVEEWIAYHRLIGIERFILFDDDPALPLASLLAHHAPYVTVVPWAGQRQRSTRRLPQVDAYLHALTLLPPSCAWVTFLDGDEFLVLRHHASLAHFLEPFEGIGQVMLQWLVFGHNGHFDDPPGLITASLTRRRAEPSLRTKFLARPEAIADIDSPHACELRPGWQTAAASGQPFSPLLDTRSTRVAHVNHYQCRSFSTWMARVARGDVNFSGTPATPETRWRLDEPACLRAFVDFVRDTNEQVDEYMLRFQAPILRALARARSPSR